MFKWLKEFRSLWYYDIVRRQKGVPFTIFIFFLASFAVARILAYYFSHHNSFYGYHIHHFFWGIAFLIAANWIALVGKGGRLMYFCAALFGMGLGMVMDEIWLMIVCGTPGMICDPDKFYWARFSYDIIMYVVIVFLLIIYFKPFWNVFKRRILGIFYKPFRVYSDVERQVKKRIEEGQKTIKEEIEKGRKLIKKEIKKRI